MSATVILALLSVTIANVGAYETNISTVEYMNDITSSEMRAAASIIAERSRASWRFSIAADRKRTSRWLMVGIAATFAVTVTLLSSFLRHPGSSVQFAGESILIIIAALSIYLSMVSVIIPHEKVCLVAHIVRRYGYDKACNIVERANGRSRYLRAVSGSGSFSRASVEHVARDRETSLAA